MYKYNETVTSLIGDRNNSIFCLNDFKDNDVFDWRSGYIYIFLLIEKTSDK